MLDRYWYGSVERISPEAPVPVVSINKNDERLGGAANVARNVTALGAQCTLLTLCGDDGAADTLQRLIDEAGIESIIQRDSNIDTTVKLRIISQNQQLIRADFESPVSKAARQQLRDAYLAQLENVDAVVVSDYGKGGLGHIQDMIVAARNAAKPVLIDPKGHDYSAYKGATLITPNRKEFELVAGQYDTEDALLDRARTLARTLSLDAVLVTRSEEGMSFVMADGEAIHMPARAREVYDVTGAGDTVIAAIGAAYGAGVDARDALRLANAAAGIVVGKVALMKLRQADVCRNGRRGFYRCKYCQCTEYAWRNRYCCR